MHHCGVLSYRDVSDLEMSDSLEEPDSDSVRADANEAESGDKQLEDAASDSELLVFCYHSLPQNNSLLN